MSPPDGAPDVSVVVIGYNDADHLATAVGSVLDQTLRNLEVLVVDDASTDGMGGVADRLADEHPRVRVVHLPVNSGGCSRPRNVGIELARAPYVMFLDSDDVYERHACKNLVLEAERTGADVVAGRCVRVFLDRGVEREWAPGLFEHRATYAGIRAMPRLFFDPLSTNKLYRRQFLVDAGITFPEGVHYEDSLFSTKVYCQAGTVAVIPNVVYYWNVVTDTEEKSITQRRFQIDNFRDRLTVHRMIDEYLAERGDGDLKVHKDFKFVRHDLRIYLTDLPAREVRYQHRFVDLAADYLGTVDDETLAMLEPVERICVDLLRRRDLDGVLTTVDYLKHGYKVSTDLIERDGRVYWSAAHLDTSEDRAVMDVTELGLHRLPWPDLALFHDVRAVDCVDGRLMLDVRLLNLLRRIRPQDGLTLAVTVRKRGQSSKRSFPARVLGNEGAWITWRVEIDLSRAIGPLDQLVPGWDVRVETVWHGERNVSALTVDPRLLADLRIPLRGRFGGVARGWVEPFVTAHGNLALQQADDEGLAVVAGRLHEKTQRAKNSLRGRSLNALSHPEAKRRAYRFFRRLPVRRGLAVFESHMGMQFSDSPKYVYEAARRIGFAELGLTPVWSVAGRTTDVPDGAQVVQRNSWRYHYLLARAQFWIDNQGLPRHLSPRRETTYLQTWHGTPLKRMGFDSPELATASQKVRRQVARSVARWSALLVPSEYFVDTFVRSYEYDGELLRIGLPRNDLLVQGVDHDWVAAKKRRLELPADRKIALYAPTFRDRARRTGREYQLPFDLEAVGRELGDEWFVVVRTHYLDSVRLRRRHLPYARDLSRHDDVTELLLLADVLVTDYSSVMFDFANTGKPMIFYTYDYEEYVRDERGTYFELERRVPGPMVQDTAGLVQALRDVDAAQEKYAEEYADFRAEFCTYESGHASEAVVERLFRHRGRP